MVERGGLEGGRRGVRGGIKVIVSMSKVTVYSTPTCPYCQMAKAYLAEQGVLYTDIDVSADPKLAEEMINKSGQMGVPVIEIDGKMVVGFDQKAIDGLLGKA